MSSWPPLHPTMTPFFAPLFLVTVIVAAESLPFKYDYSWGYGGKAGLVSPTVYYGSYTFTSHSVSGPSQSYSGYFIPSLAPTGSWLSQVLVKPLLPIDTYQTMHSKEPQKMMNKGNNTATTVKTMKTSSKLEKSPKADASKSKRRS